MVMGYWRVGVSEAPDGIQGTSVHCDVPYVPIHLFPESAVVFALAPPAEAIAVIPDSDEVVTSHLGWFWEHPEDFKGWIIPPEKKGMKG